MIKQYIKKRTESIAKAMQVPTDHNQFKSGTIISIYFLTKNSWNCSFHKVLFNECDRQRAVTEEQ